MNHYGPTETTVGALAYRVPARLEEHAATVPLGRPLPGARAYVLDGRMQPLPVGVPGELYVGGGGVARGYLRRPDLTAERFVPDPFGPPGTRAYRTGDRVRWLASGELEFLGRVDRQVKIRGFRVEPGEVEAVLAQHPSVQEAAVESREGALVAYVVGAPGTEASAGELRDDLARRLPPHMVPSAFVVLGALPLTPNGKLDREALPAPGAPSREPEGYRAPRTPAERTLAGIWAEALGVEHVGVHDNFFALGGDSILAIRVIARAAQAGLRIAPQQLFRHQTVAGLAAVAVAVALEPPAAEGPAAGVVPLTPIQRRFFARELPDPHHYNQALLLRVREPLAPAQLEAAIAALLEHHDALRLRFTRGAGGWEQRYAPPGGTVPLERADLSGFPAAEQDALLESAAAERQARLELENGPLLRAVRFDLGPSRGERLLLVVHHLAVDGVSWRILLEDLECACRQLARGEAASLPRRTTSYRRWAERLQDLARSGEPRAELPFWTEQARETAPLPVDRAGGEGTVGSARTVVCVLDEEETRALLTEVPGAYRTQANDVLLCALAQAFQRWTGERVLRIHLEGHGREELFADVDPSRTVGWFTSLFPVRLELEEGGPGEVLKGVKEQLRAIPRRGIGYGMLRHLSDDPGVREALRGAPEPEVLFNYLGQFGRTYSGLSLFGAAEEGTGPSRAGTTPRAQLLEINARVSGGRLRLVWTYGEEVHARETIERLAAGYVEALRELIAHCTAPGAGGATPSDFPLARISRAELDRLAERVDGIEDLYPLSPLQQGILFHALQGGDDPYRTQAVYVLDGPLAADEWERAWARVAERHAALRTGFHWEGVDAPVQVVRRSAPLPWVREDWRGLA
ncbi:MAG TPA: condensation domain-containing protein, partial [Longimicrobiaceae bacterium]|nr:condensation domain-containing protein [Longimicrobiaceae bacterium]